MVEYAFHAPVGRPRAAVLVLSGSSGRVESARAQLLAGHGALAMSYRWFGGPGQPPGICEVPLEGVVEALDALRDRAPGVPLGILGTSKGAEAAVAVAGRDHRVDAVVAVSPSHVAWANVGPGLDGVTYPYRSSWTWQGVPLPYVTLDEGWTPGPAPTAYRDLYRRSLRLDPARTTNALLHPGPARHLLVAGGDDALWPSLAHALALEALCRSTSVPVELVTTPHAGHRVVLPGEQPLPANPERAFGGTDDADRALGRLVWPRLLETLSLSGPRA